MYNFLKGRITQNDASPPPLSHSVAHEEDMCLLDWNFWYATHPWHGNYMHHHRNQYPHIQLCGVDLLLQIANINMQHKRNHLLTRSYSFEENNQDKLSISPSKNFPTITQNVYKWSPNARFTRARTPINANISHLNFICFFFQDTYEIRMRERHTQEYQ